MGLCCGGGLLVCLVFCTCASDVSLWQERDFCCWPTGYEQVKDDIGRLLRREARLVLLYPLIPLLGAAQTTCKSGAPTWVYAIFMPVLLRAKYMEWRILQAVASPTLWTICSAAFVLGALDTADWMTDGIFPVQALACGADATDRFAEAFDQSWAKPLAPLVRTIGFGGLSYLVLAVAALAQQAVMTTNWAWDQACSLAADVAGFGTVADHYDKQMGGGAPHTDRLGMSMSARVLLENCLQLWVQASFFGLVFEELSPSARTKALLSLMLGLVSAAYKSAMTTLVVVGDRRWDVAIIPALVLGTIAWTAAKVYFAYSCDSHLWNLTSGCVRLTVA